VISVPVDAEPATVAGENCHQLDDDGPHETESDRAVRSVCMELIELITARDARLSCN